MLEDKNPKNQYGDSGSMKTFCSTCGSKKASDISGSSDEIDDSDKDSDNSTKDDQHNKCTSTHAYNASDGRSPDGMSVDTSQMTQETSTISDSMSNPEQAFARLFIQNPDFLTRFLESNPEIKTTPGESNTPSQKVDPQEALTAGDEAIL